MSEEHAGATELPGRQWIGWGALVASIFFCGGAHLLLRDGASGGGGVELFLRWKVVVGLFVYGCGTILWLACLSSLPLSVAFPASALQFVFVMAGARLLLGEPLPPLRVIGGTVILIGILLSGRRKAEIGELT